MIYECPCVLDEITHVNGLVHDHETGSTDDCDRSLAKKTKLSMGWGTPEEKKAAGIKRNFPKIEDSHGEKESINK